MSDPTRERRLSAVLLADIAGYTHLIEMDTDATVLAWKSALSEIIDPAIAECSGRIVKYTGDGFLAEFATVQSAVDCAINMQSSLSAASLAFRMGVALGDVVDDGRDIHGEGVNIAARIEALSEPGLVSVSGETRRLLRSAAKKDFHFNGSFDLKHISEPVEIWSWPRPFQKKYSEHRTFSNVPRLYVGEFEANPGEAADMALALASDLTNAFGKQTGLTLVLKRENAHYSLEGQVRVAGNRWRIVAQLIDVEDGRCVWSNRYDEIGGDLFDLQDRTASRIAGTVRISIPGLIADKIRDRPLTEMTVQELLNHAMGSHYNPSRDSWERANAALRHAIQIDEDNWMAMTMLCFNIISTRRLFDWRAPSEAEVRESRDWIEKALCIRSSDHVIRTVRGYFELFCNLDVGAARLELEEALSLNPNYYHALNIMSLVELFEGHQDRSNELANRTLECDPAYPYRHLYQRDAGWIALSCEDYEKSIDHYLRADRSAPKLPMNLIGLTAAYSLAGEVEAASTTARALSQAFPEFKVDELAKMPFRDESKQSLMARTLRPLGL